MWQPGAGSAVSSPVSFVSSPPLASLSAIRLFPFGPFAAVTPSSPFPPDPHLEHCCHAHGCEICEAAGGEVQLLQHVVGDEAGLEPLGVGGRGWVMGSSRTACAVSVYREAVQGATLVSMRPA